MSVQGAMNNAIFFHQALGDLWPYERLQFVARTVPAIATAADRSYVRPARARAVIGLKAWAARCTRHKRKCRDAPTSRTSCLWGGVAVASVYIHIRRRQNLVTRPSRSGRVPDVARIHNSKKHVSDEFSLMHDFKCSAAQVEAVNEACRVFTLDSAQQKASAVLAGATGTGKTLVLASIIARLQVPTLVLCHNKTLLKQLHRELARLFPLSRVESFTSPFRLYIPSTLHQNSRYSAAWGVKDDCSSQARWSALNAVEQGTRCIVVASVSALYGCGHGPIQPFDIEEREPLIDAIQQELREQCGELRMDGKTDAANTLQELVETDLRSISERGLCSEMVDKYASFLPADFKQSLLERFTAMHGQDWFLAVDESHECLRQFKSPSQTVQSHTKKLIDAGLRLKSALKHGPISLDRFFEIGPSRVLYLSATPGELECVHARGNVIRMVHRPTHILDPIVEMKHVVDPEVDMWERISRARGQVLVACTTAIDAEKWSHLYNAFNAQGKRSDYLVGGMDLAHRHEVITKFRQGTFHVLFGVRLICEGLDLPGVAHVLVRDADGSGGAGLVRRYDTLSQLAGRASRNVNGHVTLYFRKQITLAMERTFLECLKRREEQQKYNSEHGLVPQQLQLPRASKEGSPERPARIKGPELGSSLLPAAPIREVRAKRPCVWMVEPELQVDQLALAGCRGLGIESLAAGCPRIGPVRAKWLLDEFGSLENVLNAVNSDDKASKESLGRCHFGTALLNQLKVHASALRKCKKLINGYRYTMTQLRPSTEGVNGTANEGVSWTEHSKHVLSSGGLQLMSRF
mmetsp:Transcript_87205/g.244702  ORF Transcript_87205/g.244702 Transcript_87205/m.244702 type:complete len:806 (-) Transcript_87205:226-2643(-)|eukprot:CAMPEP_0117562444 /NCGR_PEP_ID=MMETSP0784-20121206/54960_1 /TAXON_ID=39447 /ORGANISM="" /LENGTH=805 /DNA_ID=CAMNT_0005360015 /DNA_START=182 /DNA_END=2599 /DNA_ORIENTATION=-